jgi:transmembrane sensor
MTVEWTMPTRDEFEAGLRAADAAFASHDLPRDFERRLRQRLAEARPRPWGVAWPRWQLGVALAAGLVVAVGVAFVVRMGQVRPARLGEWVVASATPDLRATVDPQGLLAIEGGACTLEDVEWTATLDIANHARLRREPRGIRVMSGTVSVRVAKRPPGAAVVQVLVSHGVIQVVGTRFTIVQGERGGRVTLHEGVIRFVRGDRDAGDAGGEVVELRAPQSLTWPPEPAPPPPATAPASGPLEDAGRGRRETRRAAPPPSTLRPEQLPEFLEGVAALRSRGQYDEAVRELRRRLPTAQGRATRERLSFELGSILTYQLQDRPSACAHWRWHREAFRPHRYAALVRQAEQRAGCGATRPQP